MGVHVLQDCSRAATEAEPPAKARLTVTDAKPAAKSDPAVKWIEMGVNSTKVGCRCDIDAYRSFGGRVESPEECKQMCLDKKCAQFEYNKLKRNGATGGWCNVHPEECALHCNPSDTWKAYSNPTYKRLKATPPVAVRREVSPHQPEPQKVEVSEAEQSLKKSLKVMARNAAQSNRATVLDDVDTPHDVEVKLSNKGSKPLTFSKWGTPFEDEISYKSFRSEPATSTYLGKVEARESKMLPKESLIIVNPGEEITKTIDINKLLAFHEKGSYRVFVDIPLLTFEPNMADTYNAADATETSVSAEFHINVQEGGVTPPSSH